MKARVKLFGVLFVLGVSLLVPSNRSTGQERFCLNVKAPVMMWEPEESRWSLASIAGVLKSVGDLQAMIQAIPSHPRPIDLIGDEIYGANGILTGHDGKTYRGPAAIKGYLAGLRDFDVREFRIEVKFVYAKEFTDVLNRRKDPQDVVHSLYFVLSNSFKVGGQWVDPPGVTSCPHVRLCDCDRSK